VFAYFPHIILIFHLWDFDYAFILLFINMDDKVGDSQM